MFTPHQIARLKINRVDPKTAAVGDRVRYVDESVGTVVAVSADRTNGYGSIQWDGDAAPVESAMRTWDMLRKV